MNQGTNLGSQIGRWIVLAALVAVLGALLLTIRPVGAQTSSCVVVGDDLECTYAENGTGRVYDFHATDPDRGGVVIWELVTTVPDATTYPDHGVFEIDRQTGVLTFKNSPNYEAAEDSGEDNTYKVKVKAGDGEDAFASIGVTVRVTNLEETGTATLTNLQPQVKSDLGYNLSDADGNDNVSGQQWSKSRSMTSGYTNITGATSATYSPKNEDINYYLRVTVTYVDGAGEGHDTAKASSMYPVRQLPDEENTNPAFPEENLDDDQDTDTTSRMIDENTPAGMNVGPPVVATDANLDVLTYKLGGTDAASFSIDPATGQIMTKAALNHETSETLTVTVTATDPFLVEATTEVEITVTDLNEAPGAITGPSAIKRDEGPDLTLQGGTYIATDNDHGDTVSYAVSGTDASVFMIGEDNGELMFKTGKAPNFEMPGDDGKNNLYEVTVVARGSKWATSTKVVTIKVTNIEEPGSITLSHTHPEVETSLTATLTDVDEDITGRTWQWYRGSSPNVENLPTTECTGNDDNCRIDGATSNTYRPKTSDFSPTARTLYVVATYRDGAPNVDNEGTLDVDESKLPTKLAQVAANPVRDKVTSNASPYFEKDGDSTDPPTKVTTYVRTIEEGAAIDTAVSGGDVAATDTATNPDDNDKLVYTLDGPDKAYFMLNDSQEIQLKKELDYDTKQRHRVTVKATDPSGGSATVTVHINVTDVDEAPEIDGPARVESYMENGTGPVATFMAKDPERTAITWMVKDENDNEEFEVSRASGSQTMLQFKKSPNWEMPTGGDAGNSNIYTVTLVATVVGAGDSPTATDMDEHTVMVRVTDVEETPEFEKSTDTLSVEENVPANTDIGLPVVAEDSDNDALTSSLSGSDADSFAIIPATGQILTKAKLDYETKDSYSVVVTATDPTDRKDTINITIEVKDVAEKPTITDGGLTVSGLASENYPEDRTDAVATYTAEGENEANARWTLEGDDSGDFRLSSTSGATTMLRFSSLPNFEMPTDADTDNTYMVTVKASYGSGDEMVMDTQDVTVYVTDVNEDGTVTLSPASPMVDEEVTATLTDPDGMMDNIWQWSKSMTKTGDFMDIDGATSMTYTPVKTDDSHYLRVKVTYTDAHGSQMEMATTDMAVTSNRPPAFADDDATREVAENTAAGMNVGEPVTATDPDGDALTYALSGADAMYFTIDNMGQIKVGASAMLDYESMKKTYMVTVTATDPGGEADTIVVTINVTDVEENPLLAEYDTNKDAMIDRSEAIAAIRGYLAGEPGFSRAEVIAVLRLYLGS